jgi:hypothetical protein
MISEGYLSPLSSPPPLNSSVIEDPHPYPSPLAGEGKRVRGASLNEELWRKAFSSEDS